MRVWMKLTPQTAAPALAGLVMANRTQIGADGSPGRVLAGILIGRIRYRRYDPSEHWQTIEEIVAAGHGDCEDLAAAVCAELNCLGIDARLRVRRMAAKVWHVLVFVPGVGELDPSQWAGMTP